MPNLNMPGEGGARPPVQPMMPGRDTGGAVKKLVIIIVAVAVVGGGGFFLYQSGLLPFGKKKPSPLPPPAEVVPPPAEVAPTPPAEAAKPPVKQPPAETKPVTPPPTTKPMGTGNFTVVIHSFTSRTLAEEVAAQWSNAGFPAMVTEKGVGGSVWYRVSVGRYQTRQTASQAGKEIEHMLETGYWVSRLQ